MSKVDGAQRCALLALDGVAPGVGKSTLASILAASVGAQGLRVEHFREEDILSHPALAAIAREFRATGRVAPDTLLASTGEYVASLDAAGADVAVLDALLPFLPSLVAWGHDEPAVADFIRRLTAVLRGRRLVLGYLDGSPERALARAREREGPEWFSWLLGRYQGVAGSPPTDEESLLVHLRSRRELTLRLLRDNGWEVVVLDADGWSPEQLAEIAIAALAVSRRSGEA